MIIQPGPVVDFLIANQNVRDPFSIDWTKVILMLHLMRLLIFLVLETPVIFNCEYAAGEKNVKESKDQNHNFKPRIQNIGD